MISYCSTVHIREGNNINSNSEPRLALLALSPMAEATANTNETNEGEATTFNSETNIHFFKEVFHFYGLDFETWTLCLISDNTSTNHGISKLTGKTMVGCNAHKLNLELNHMCDRNQVFGNTLSSVHDTMRSAKTLKTLQYSAT